MKHPSPTSFLAGPLVQGKQQGFSLITTLILLVVVTMLGIGASQMALLSERSTRFDRDQQIAFQAAEAALIDAEFDIRSVTSTRHLTFKSKKEEDSDFIDGCGTGALRGLCRPAAEGTKPVWYLVDFTDETANAKTVKLGEFTGRAFSVGASGIRPEIAPRYIIESIPDGRPGASKADDRLYRVTAMGFGPRKETQAVVQMIFRKE
jgi:type IV pilus assembly protein PilX